MGGSPPGHCLSWTVQDGGREPWFQGGGQRKQVSAVWARLPHPRIYISPSRMVSAGLAPQVKHPHFCLARMLGETPPCAACALRHTELFAELDLCLKHVFGRTVFLPGIDLV